MFLQCQRLDLDMVLFKQKPTDLVSKVAQNINLSLLNKKETVLQFKTSSLVKY